MSNNILVTGASGFVGKYCISRFEQEDKNKLILLCRKKNKNIIHEQIETDLESITAKNFENEN